MDDLIINIKNKIHNIKGKQVMLDSDLAELYCVDVKRLNEQVKRNIERFPEDFMFQIEEEVLRSQIATLNKSRGRHRKYLPFAFTEQGVAMLSSVLKNKKAVEINIMIMRAFVAMRNFLLKNNDVFNRLDIVERRQIEYQIKTDKNFEEIFDALQLKEPSQGIFFDGTVFDEFIFISDLIKKANNEIILIDNYVDENTLNLFSDKKQNVSVKIYTTNLTEKLLLAVKKFNEQFGGAEIFEFTKSHDRFLIVDKEVYHIGASLKDLGKKWYIQNESMNVPKTVCF